MTLEIYRESKPSNEEGGDTESNHETVKKPKPLWKEILEKEKGSPLTREDRTEDSRKTKGV